MKNTIEKCACGLLTCMEQKDCCILCHSEKLSKILQPGYTTDVKKFFIRNYQDIREFIKQNIGENKRVVPREKWHWGYSRICYFQVQEYQQVQEIINEKIELKTKWQDKWGLYKTLHAIWSDVITEDEIVALLQMISQTYGPCAISEIQNYLGAEDEYYSDYYGDSCLDYCSKCQYQGESLDYKKIDEHYSFLTPKKPELSEYEQENNYSYQLYLMQCPKCQHQEIKWIIVDEESEFLDLC